MAHNVVKDALEYASLTERMQHVADHMVIGEEISLHARAHSTRPPKLLHTETASNRRKFSVDDKHTSVHKATITSDSDHTFSQRPLYVSHVRGSVNMD